MGQRILEVAQDRVLGFDGLLHLFTDFVDGSGVEARTLHELSQSQLLLLVLSLEYTKFLFEHLVLVIGSVAELAHGDFELVVHILLVSLDLDVLLVEIVAVLFELFQPRGKVLQYSSDVTETHLVFGKGAHLLPQVVPDR